MITEENIINEEEWDDFQPVHALSPDVSDKLWNNINKNAIAPVARYPYLRWIAVAASVILLAGLSWNSALKKQTTGRISATTVATTKTIFNNTFRKMTFALSDGSTVELSPKSMLSYPANFNSVKRDVTLNGEATFNIAKDVAKPFSVYSNSVLVTVLGTRFTVNAYAADNAAKVILHEGRIMVKISNPSSRNNKNEYYLSVGDIFIVKKINRRSRTLNAEPVTAEPVDPGPVATSKGISSDSLSVRILHLEKDKDECYTFNNYSLDVVFDQLQIIYNTKIIYNKAELGNRSFIGKIDKKDSLSHILQSIALLNNFGLHKQGDSFIISTASPY